MDLICVLKSIPYNQNTSVLSLSHKNFELLSGYDENFFHNNFVYWQTNLRRHSARIVSLILHGKSDDKINEKRVASSILCCVRTGVTDSTYTCDLRIFFLSIKRFHFNDEYEYE